MRTFPVALILAVTAAVAPAQTTPPTPKPPALQSAVTFTCSARKGPTQLTAATVVSDTAAGWDLNTAPTVANGVCSSDKPFFFSVPIAEGNYSVTTILGGKQASVITVRAEARRLMLEKIPIAAGRTITRSIDVNIRVPDFTDPTGVAKRVRLKPREIGNLDWDPKLTLEFNGTNPSVRSITIEPLTGAKAEPTIYLGGDSTMVDQDIEPWASWGQMFPRFFLPGIVIANHAESGETSKSFRGEMRMAKILSLIQPGDYFFMQFNHNDQKAGAVTLDEYRQILTEFVAQVRAKGATPVIVTAQHRMTFDDSGHITNSLGAYPDAARDVAAATKTALIDLTAMSKIMFEAMGPDTTVHAFMHFAANTFPGQNNAINDNTHFNNYGAYELARCIVHGIREVKLPIARFLDPSVPDMDPAKFDPFPTFALPFTPMQRNDDTTKVPQT